MPRRSTHLRRRAHRIWTRIRCRLRGSQSLRALLQQIEPARTRLADFGGETDKQFTALARELGGLNEQFGVMKEALRKLDDILNDRDQTHAIGAARVLCKNSVELVHASLGVAHTVRERMNRVDAGLKNTCAMREDFDKSFLLLRTVAMGFRVEAARVDSEFQAVFANVAAAISDIDHRIAASTRGAFAQIETLLRESAEERLSVDAGEQGAFAGAQAAISAVHHDLESLQAMLAPLAHATVEIAGDVEKSGPLVLEVLRALQFQDIVRQRLEHVGDGLADIGDTAAAVAGREWREIAYFGHAARIQAGQLVAARGEISGAAEAVTGGLAALLGLGGEILTRLTELEAQAESALASDRMAAMFAREIANLASIAEAAERASRRVAGLVDRIQAVVTVFSEEIEKQVREVKLVALNAQVAAARLPCAGALEKLAEETTRISRDNAATSRNLAGSLRETLQCLQGIRGEADEFLSAVATEKAVIERGASDIGVALREHGQDVRRMSTELRSRYSSVQERMQQTLAAMDFGAQIDACFAPVEGLCVALEEAAGEDILEAIPRDTRLEDHASRYTMQHERDTHRAAAAACETENSPVQRVTAAPAPAAVPTAAPSLVSAPVSAPASAPGDIELF